MGRFWSGLEYNNDVKEAGGLLSCIGAAIAIIVFSIALAAGESLGIVLVAWGIAISLVVLCIAQPVNLKRIPVWLNNIILANTMHKPSGFNLAVGMTNKQIYNELHRKTSGETEQEVKFLLSTDHSPTSIHAIDRATKIFGKGQIIGPALEVVDANERYALIKKTHMRGAGTQSSPIQNDEIYYLTGINDEGYYFVHAVDLRQIVQDLKRSSTLSELVDYTNRKDEGYERLQGDVLYRFIDIKLNIIKDYEYTLNGRTYSTSHARPLDDPILSPIRLGNHEVYYTGNYVSHPNHTVILGTKIIMKHPQHADVVLDIPEGKAALLTHQRGRDVVLPDSMTQRVSNFD